MYSVLVGTEKGLIPLGNIPPHIYKWAEKLQGIPITALHATHDGIGVILNKSSVHFCHNDGEVIETEKSAETLTSLYHWQGDLIVGTYKAHLMRVKNRRFELVQSFENAPQRDKWFTPWGDPPSVRSMSSNTKDLYVNIHVGGVVRSTDSGTWEQLVDIDVDVHQVLIPNPEGNRVLVATGMAGLGESQDGGKTWSFSSTGMHSTYCRAIAVSEENVFISCADGPNGQHATIYSRALDASRETPFKRCDLEPVWFDDNINTYCLQAYGTDVAFGTRMGEVYVSRDRGSEWYQVIVGLPAIQCLLVLPGT